MGGISAGLFRSKSCLEKISILPLGVSSGILFWIAPKIFKGNGRLVGGSCPCANILCDEFIQRRQFRKTDPAEFIQTIFDPRLFIAPLGEGLADSQSFGQLGTDAIIRFAFARRLDQLGLQDHFIAVLPAILHTPGFELGAGWQDHIGKACAGGEKVILDDDEFHL